MAIRNPEDTICALATPPGLGGISVIRVCGKSAKENLRKLINLPEDLTSHRVYFLNISDITKSKTIDECLVTYFQEGRSYTGDDTFEISCHGSPVVVDLILQNLILSGCRSAERGEFTFRAFMAGNIDLLQAEGVLSLIESETHKAHEVALSHLKGELSNEITKIKEQLTRLLAHQEASIDFAMENLETINSAQTTEQILEIKQKTEKLLNTYKTGKVLTESLKVSIVGAPNAGKSSLFNALLKKDKAIVTEIAGTTRDVLEGEVVLAGVKIKFFDTAGVHKTMDKVETLGIEKTKKQIKESDYIFYVFDKGHPPKLEKEILDSGKEILFLGNKCDLYPGEEFSLQLKRLLSENVPQKQELIYFDTTSTDVKSLSPLFAFLEKKLQESFLESSSVVLKARQFELLKQSLESLNRAYESSIVNASAEFIALELRESLESMFELLGERFDDEIMDKVFNEFCIGK